MVGISQAGAVVGDNFGSEGSGEEEEEAEAGTAATLWALSLHSCATVACSHALETESQRTEFWMRAVTSEHDSWHEAQ